MLSIFAVGLVISAIAARKQRHSSWVNVLIGGLFLSFVIGLGLIYAAGAIYQACFHAFKLCEPASDVDNGIFLLPLWPGLIVYWVVMIGYKISSNEKPN